MAKISVIIPAYNAMHYLPETLNSALCQTLSDIEIIIVNDGSTDKIIEWASTIQDPRVRLINQENKGMSGARNTGIRASDSEYFAFLDADDTWEDTKLQKQLDIMECLPEIGLVSCWISEIDEHGELIAVHESPSLTGESLLQELYLYNFVHCGSTPLVRRSCFQQAGIFDETITSAEDWDMWLRISRHCTFYVVQEALASYRRHSKGISRDMVLMLRETEKIMKHAFLNGPLAVQHLKGVGVAKAAQHYAWKSLERSDFPKARWFVARALFNNPKLILSRSFCYLAFLTVINRLG
jgi:glycosyltransferase involved in cell wall biosynthesis